MEKVGPSLPPYFSQIMHFKEIKSNKTKFGKAFNFSVPRMRHRMSILFYYFCHTHGKQVREIC
jgi:hypothetical protein